MGLFKKGIKVFGILILTLGLGVIFLIWLMTRQSSDLKIADVIINQKKIKVEIATSPLELYRGLSSRAELCSNCGMLFNFTNSEEQEFVMRDMNFPLDIIFINNGQIINIAANSAPEGNNPRRIYHSVRPTNQVLEINGGYAEASGFKIGDLVLVENISRK